MTSTSVLLNGSKLNSFKLSRRIRQEKFDDRSMSAIQMILQLFMAKSRQTINFEKSQVAFSSKCEDSRKASIFNALRIRETLNLGKYLGFRMHMKRVTKHDYEFIVDKIRNKLCNTLYSIDH